jgi:hypothetical protein
MPDVPAGADPLADLMEQVARDEFPPADGGVTVVGPDRTTGLHASLSFTGHAVVATDLTREQVLATGADGLAGAHAQKVLIALAGPGGWIGVLDVVLVARGTGRGSTLDQVDHHDDHHRVGYARDLRVDVRVLADDHGLVTVGRGLGGRAELGFELTGADHGGGHGRRLLRAALDAMPEGEPVFASCAPGNARSLRALLAVGFRVIGGEVLLRPRRAEPGA